MKVAVIFVLYHTPTKQLFKVKKEFKTILKSCKFYVTDNTKTGKGFAYGVNQALLKAQKDNPDIFIIANTDIDLPKTTQENFLEGLKKFDILGFAMVQNGKKFYGGRVDKLDLGGRHIAKKPDGIFTHVRYVTGSLMVIKNEVIEKTGLFDESFFMYFEDVDYCFRASKKGFRIGINSKLFYNHYELSRFNDQKMRLLAQSHLLFIKKYGTKLQYLLYNVYAKLRYQI